MTGGGVELLNVAAVTATLERIATTVEATPPESIAAMAGAIAIEAPVLTGYLRASVGSGEGGILITAPYAAITNARNDYIGRGIVASEESVRLAWEARIDQVTLSEGAR